MSKKLAMLSLSALFCVSVFSACDRNLTCKNIAEKNNKCSEEISSYVQKRKMKEKGFEVPASNKEGKESKLAKSQKAYLDKIGRKAAKAFSAEQFIQSCKPIMKDKSKAAKLEECFKSTKCGDYIKCMMKIEDIAMELNL
jgi:hypothetical protein